jgi:putative copper export protein
MAATVVWVGGLVFQTVILAPALRADRPETERILRDIRRRFQPAAGISLAVLVATGLVQMGASPNYAGVLSIQNPWSVAILAKHIAILGMALLAAYQTWWLHPQVEREFLRRPPSGPPDHRTQRRLQALIRANLVLSLIVLGLTAAARVA